MTTLITTIKEWAEVGVPQTIIVESFVLVWTALAIWNGYRSIKEYKTNADIKAKEKADKEQAIYFKEINYRTPHEYVAAEPKPDEDGLYSFESLNYRVYRKENIEERIPKLVPETEA